MPHPPYPVTSPILVVEDDENHAFFIRRAFQQAGLLNPVHFVQDGDQALAYLAGEGPYANRDEFPLPSLVLLDLKLPNTNGFEVLEWVRAHPTLSGLRIIVLTTSGATSDINRAYRLGANSFLTKPMNFTELVQLTRWVKGYWLHCSSEPEISRTPVGREVIPDPKSSAEH
jgi:CheY-like chemotaxis protein